jgi:hypothetical protein
MITTIYIGIDPDITASGVAVYDKEDNSLELRTLSFWELIEEIESYLVPIHIVIEAGHLIKKSNWHGAANTYTAARIGKNVGSNHQIGKLIQEYCEKHNISHELIKPLGKVNQEIFNGIWERKGRTNQEVRDAAMLIYRYKNTNKLKIKEHDNRKE